MNSVLSGFNFNILDDIHSEHPEDKNSIFGRPKLYCFVRHMNRQLDVVSKKGEI